MQKIIVLISLLALSTQLMADYVLKYKMSGETQTYKYKDSKNEKIVLDAKDGHSEIIKNVKSIYMVSYEDDGEVSAVDMKAMKARAASYGMDISQMQFQPESLEYKIKKTSKKVKLAGIDGEVWIIYKKGSKSDKGEKIVVTKNKEIVKAVKSMFALYSNMSGFKIDNSYIELEKGYVTIKAPEMELTSYKRTKVSKKEFEIPKDKVAKSNDKPQVKQKQKTDNTAEDISKEATKLFKSFF